MQRERFTNPLSLELIDLVRLESQAVAPALQEHAKIVAGLSQVFLIEKYGEFIHPKPLKKNQNIAERIIIVDNPEICDVALFPYENDILNERIYNLSAAAQDGLSDQVSGIVYIAVPDLDIFDGEEIIDSELFGRGVLSGNLDMALELAAIEQTVAHEVSHQYGDDLLLYSFFEAGTIFLEMEIVEWMGSGYIRSLDHYSVQQLYGLLLQRFGDKLHSLYFGTLGNYQDRREIIRNFKLLSESEEFSASLAHVVRAL